MGRAAHPWTTGDRCNLHPEGGRRKSRSATPRPASGSNADAIIDSDGSRSARPPANRLNAFGVIKLVGNQQIFREPSARVSLVKATAVAFASASPPYLGAGKSVSSMSFSADGAGNSIGSSEATADIGESPGETIPSSIMPQLVD